MKNYLPKNDPLKNYLCAASVCLLFVTLNNPAHAADTPVPIELKGTFHSIAFSPERNLVLTIDRADADCVNAAVRDGGTNSGGVVRVWDAVSGEELAKLEHQNRVRSAVFSSDSTMVATIDTAGTARIWHLDWHLPKEQRQRDGWKPLFDGESHEGWSIPVYGGDGEVDVQNGNFVIGRGALMTGIRYEKEFPKVNYEIQYEARRVQGYDFFAACTFPVKDSFCTFINGGWGGGTTGLSNVDGYDASENPSSLYFNYLDNVWYRFRIRVTEDRIQVWITPQDKEGNWGEERSVINLNMEDKEVSTRLEVEKYKPLAFTTWATEGHLQNIQYRVIE